MRVGLMFVALIVFFSGCGSREPQQQTTAPSSMNDSMAKGMDYLKKSDVASAIRTFDDAIRKDPKNLQNYLTLGQVYLHLKRYPQASDTFQAATRVAPESGECYYLLAMSRELQGVSKKQAIEAAEKSIAIFQKNRDEEGFKRAMILLKGISESNSFNAAKEASGATAP